MLSHLDTPCLHSPGASAKHGVSTLHSRVTVRAPDGYHRTRRDDTHMDRKMRSPSAGGKGLPGQQGPSVAGIDRAIHHLSVRNRGECRS
jgi:hypothetical protein